jgi:hypothetical protein
MGQFEDSAERTLSQGCECCGRVYAVGRSTFAEAVGVLAIWAIIIGGGIVLGLLVAGRL